MNFNYSLGNCSQNVNFNGRVDKKSAKLAKQMGGEIYENLQNLADKTHKNTMIKLCDMNGEYGIRAFNVKIGHGLTVGLAPKNKLADTLKNIDAKRVDESIVNAAIKNIKEEAAINSMNTTEKKMLKAEAKETLKLQRDLGLKQPFWSETKQLMAEADKRADVERIMFEKNHSAWKMANNRHFEKY